MIARIHSIQTFGTVDGPGIRYVVFFQGCRLKCKFCHNRDLWTDDAGDEMTVDQVIEDIKKYIPFLEASGGGVTVTGGEPLLQMPFIIELFKECRKLNLHTAVDTAAAVVKLDKTFDQLLDVTDLFLLDIKHMDEDVHKDLTGMTNRRTLEVAQYLSDKQINTWIRHVVVPGYTQDVASAEKVAQFVATLKNVEKLELLPFHQMGEYKWAELGEEYSLKGVPTPTAEDLKPIKAVFEKYKIPVSCVK